ncbi:MAG: hypothetical protein LIO77_08390 [Rikenellaceae bacterium]|nr:hypothetical protein [Rikenellaceae bacterium]
MEKVLSSRIDSPNPFKIYLGFIFLCIATVSGAQEITSEREGILGPYNEAERQHFITEVIHRRQNLFGDRLPIGPTERQLRRAEQTAAGLGEGNLADYHAVFYLFPGDSEPMILYGILMPASEEIASIHLSSMHILADEKTLPRLTSLPRSTIVYGVDGSGNKAWFPLEFFSEDPLYPGYISAEGLYAYTYRPNAKLEGRFGNTAYYLDILDPTLYDRAALRLEDNFSVFKNTQYIPGYLRRETTTGRIGSNDIVSRSFPGPHILELIYNCRPAFYSPLVPLLRDYPEYATTQFELSVMDSFDGGCRFDLHLPSKAVMYEEGGNIVMAPGPGIMEALERLLSTVVSEQYIRVDPKWWYKPGDVSIHHYNDAGIVVFAQKSEGGDIVREVCVRRYQDEDFTKIEGEAGKPSDKFVFVAPTDNNPGLAAFYREFTAHNGAEAIPEREVKNMLSKYDMSMPGIKKVRMNVAPVREDPTHYIPCDRYFLLDLVPDSRTDMAGFYDCLYEWFYDNMDYSGEGSIDFEFTLGADGRMRDLEIVSASDLELILELARVFEIDMGWASGHVSGFAVDIGMKMSLEFRP